MKRTAYLFDPSDVVQVLRGLPSLGAALGDPAREGEPSTAFPLARKSERQIYRILANDHYEHLAELLRSLDYCLARGFTQPSLLRTRARSNFDSAVSELGAAEHFLLRGFVIEGLDVQRSSEPVPEFLASQGELQIAVEVYRPVEWEGLPALTDQLVETLKSLDVPLDYRFEVQVEQLDRFNEHGELRSVHPAELARQLTSSRLAAIIDPLLEEITQQLRADVPDLQVQNDEQDLNIRVSVGVSDVTSSQSTLPARWGAISPLGLTGYAPEAMFDRLVSARVRRKAARGQGRVAGRLAILIVDLAASQVTTQLSSPAYLEDFVKSMRRSFDEELPGYEVVAFCESAGAGRQLITHFAQHQDTVSEAVMRALFGSELVSAS